MSSTDLPRHHIHCATWYRIGLWSSVVRRLPVVYMADLVPQFLSRLGSTEKLSLLWMMWVRW